MNNEFINALRTINGAIKKDYSPEVQTLRSQILPYDTVKKQMAQSLTKDTDPNTGTEYAGIAEERTDLGRELLKTLKQQKGFNKKGTRNFYFRDKDGNATLMVVGNTKSGLARGRDDVIIYKFPEAEGRWVKVDGGRWTSGDVGEYITNNAQDEEKGIFDIELGPYQRALREMEYGGWYANNDVYEDTFSRPNDKSNLLIDRSLFLSTSPQGEKSDEQKRYEKFLSQFPNYATVRQQANQNLKGNQDFFKANTNGVWTAPNLNYRGYDSNGKLIPSNNPKSPNISTQLIDYLRSITNYLER